MRHPSPLPTTTLPLSLQGIPQRDSVSVVYVCMYLYVCACVHMCVCVCVRVHMRVCVCFCVSLCVYTLVCKSKKERAIRKRNHLGKRVHGGVRCHPPPVPEGSTPACPVFLGWVSRKELSCLHLVGGALAECKDVGSGRRDLGLPTAASEVWDKAKSRCPGSLSVLICRVGIMLPLP